ncbi:MAG: hypothetical protein AB7Y46_02530 [Armatimonadota bacterium]
MIGTDGGRICLAVVAAVVALAIAGCGGGESVSDEASMGTASVAGTVFGTGALESAALQTAAWAAQADGAAQPVPDCPVEVLRERDRAQLRAGRTDERGQFRFEGLPAGETVMVQARLRTGEQLMAHVRLRAGECRADIDGDSTMAAVCARLALGRGGPTSAHEQDIAEQVAGSCLQHHRRNRYRYGGLNGTGPSFDDGAQVAQAAGALLGAATDEALRTALRTRTQAQCERAVRLMQGRLQQIEGERLPWDAQACQRLATALRTGQTVAPERVAAALSRVQGQQVAVEAVQRALQRLRERLGDALHSEAPGLCEAAAAVCTMDGSELHLRVRTREQFQRFIADLSSGE